MLDELSKAKVMLLDMCCWEDRYEDAVGGYDGHFRDGYFPLLSEPPRDNPDEYR